MIKQDYFLRYVEQLAKVLAEIGGLKESGKNNQAIELIESTLKDLNINSNLNVNEVPKEYYESIADLLRLKGEINSDIELLKRAIGLYISVDEHTKTFSKDRVIKREETIALITQMMQIN